MSHNELVLAAIIGRSIAMLAAVAGSVWLAYAGKDGWGWLIFLAIAFGSYSIKETA